MTNAFDFAPLLRAGLPPAAAKFTGVPKYNFVGGHGDQDQFPVDGVIEAANRRCGAKAGRSPPMASASMVRKATAACANSWSGS